MTKFTKTMTWQFMLGSAAKSVFHGILAYIEHSPNGPKLWYMLCKHMAEQAVFSKER